MKSRQLLSAREIDQLHAWLGRRLGDTSVPTLPQVAVRVIELVGDENAGINDFSKVVKTDQALTGRLLRLANSAYFGQRNPVTQIERAVVLIGMERLKALALGFHLSRAALGEEGDFSFRRLWTQSLYRGWFALRLTERFERSLSGEAFVVGLLSDVGVPMMPRFVGERFFKVVDPEAPPLEQYVTECKNLPLTHVDVASVLCRMWRLPERLAKPICLHHTPPARPAVSDEAGLLHAVAYVCGSFTLDKRSRPTGPGFIPSLARRLLGLTQTDLEELLARASEDFKGTQGIFSHLLDASLSVEDILEHANRQLAATVECMVVAEVERDASLAESAGGARTLRYEMAGVVLEVERSDRGQVRVFILDEEGNRIASEEIDPRSASPEALRRLLLLDGASIEQIGEVLSDMRRLPA